MISWRKTTVAIGLTLVTCACLVVVVSAELRTENGQLVIITREDLTAAMTMVQSDISAMDRSHQAGQAAAAKLVEMATALSRKVAAVSQVAESVASGQSSTEALMAATKEMQEMNMSFNLQFLQLQQQMQQENRQYTMVSNIMKTRHDTAKNAINNVR